MYDDCLVLFLVVYVSSFAITFDYSIAIGKSYHFPALFLFIAVLSVSRLMIFTKDGERFRSSSVYIPFALLSLWFCMSVWEWWVCVYVCSERVCTPLNFPLHFFNMYFFLLNIILGRRFFLLCFDDFSHLTFDMTLNFSGFFPWKHPNSWWQPHAYITHLM